MFDLPPEPADEASSFVPDFTFQLVQLAELPFEKIVGTPAGILVLRTLKAEQLEKLLGPEVWDESIIKHALPTFEMVLRYTAAHQDLWNPSEANATMEKGFATPFTGKGLPGASVKKGVSNPFSLLVQNP